MDGLAWFFIILGLVILLVLIVAVILIVYCCQRRRRNKVHIDQVHVAHSCTDSSSSSSAGIDYEKKNAKNLHVFHGLPDHPVKAFEAPPIQISPEVDLEEANRRYARTHSDSLDRKSAHFASPKTVDKHGKDAGYGATVLVVDDEASYGSAYNPAMATGIQLGKFTDGRRSNELTVNTYNVGDGGVMPMGKLKTSPVSIVSVNVTDSDGPEKPARKDTPGVNGGKRPYNLNLPTAINNATANNPRPTYKAVSPILIRSFPQKLEQLTENENEALYTEFEQLEKSNSRNNHLSIAVATAPGNTRRNRFYDIVPYDFNRVVLHPRGGWETRSDYINASFIETLDGERGYIAAQGPLDGTECAKGKRDSTVDDFWRMVWDEQVDCIVMLTQCVEEIKTKCAPYWPHTAGESILVDDEIDVNLYCLVEDENSFQREFLLTNVAFPRVPPRKVLQWHFKGWHDSTSPTSPTALLHFVRQIRTSTHHAPVLVHCSAGVGRTGVFLAVDQLLDRLEAEQPLDVFGVVQHLRRQRMNMVQTAEQYIAIYDVMALAVRQRLGQEISDDLTSLDRNRWLSSNTINDATL
uniref:protein-tyrosine-phosphatase n=1 Tax=Panagrellus redivivus TaxID=6233 RepID=A0A7E4UR20_PANRE